MTLKEIENYLTPPVGIERKEVESFFGVSFNESEVNGDENKKVIEYFLFYPVYMEVIYEAGIVVKSGLHHRINLTDWSSELQFDIARAREKEPKKTEEWLRQGYLHYVQGRKLLNQVRPPSWHLQSKQLRADLTATAPESKSEDKGKPKSESEECSQ